MKRLFPFIPIFLLLLINSCAVVPSIGSDPVATGIAGTYIALTRTAAPTPTYNPHISEMENWLDNDLSTVSPLGRSMDAQYHVIKVSFTNVPDSSNLIFRVDVGCLCIKSTECCIPERTFVALMEAMKRNPNLINVPGGVTEVVVVCSEFQSGEQIGAISATWTDTYNFLHDYINGEQLSANTTRIAVPQR